MVTTFWRRSSPDGLERWAGGLARPCTASWSAPCHVLRLPLSSRAARPLLGNISSLFVTPWRALLGCNFFSCLLGLHGMPPGSEQPPVSLNSAPSCQSGLLCFFPPLWCSSTRLSGRGIVKLLGWSVSPFNQVSGKMNSDLSSPLMERESLLGRLEDLEEESSGLTTNVCHGCSWGR